ncbi:unnamed protein product [Paramecium pentaurelia]|uniref:Rho-GAP domain-containing protein n=1 Tax=Paramecium pentaurelia TaxID=43138 RepID=A0A8S1XCV6_9CILI|nr:unnamed protein product [Paramecium pentaurelia]
MLNKHYKNISHNQIRITKTNYKQLNTQICLILKKAIFYKFQVFQIWSVGIEQQHVCFLFNGNIQDQFDNNRITYHTINSLDNKIDQNTYTIVYIVAEHNAINELSRFRKILKQLPSKYYTQLKFLFLYQASLMVKTRLWLQTSKRWSLWQKKTKYVNDVEDLLKIQNFQASWMNLVPKQTSGLDQIEPTQLVKQTGGSFGSNLTNQKLNQFGIPVILDCLLSYFVTNADRFLKPDIFRKQGSINEEEQLYTLLMNENYECLNVVEDVRIVCSMIKRFFTSLPDPLIPQNTLKFICNQIVQITPQTEIALLEEVFGKLPSLNRVLLTVMVSFLLCVGNYSEFNHMNMNNLAIVFAPCFMRAQTNDISSLEQVGQSVKFLKILFDNFDKMFQNVTFKLYLQYKQTQSCSSTSSNSSTGPETMSKNQILSSSEDEIVPQFQQKQQ